MGSVPQAQQDDPAHLLDYVRILLKRLWLILGIFVLVVGIAGFATLRATPMYRSTAMIDIRQPNMALGRIDASELLQSVSNSQIYMNTRYELLASRSTVEEMVRSKKLDTLPEFKDWRQSDIIRAIAGKVEVEPKRNTSLVRVSLVSPNEKVVHKLTNWLVETFADMQEKHTRSSLDEALDALETKWLDFSRKAELQGSKLDRSLQDKGTDRETFQQTYEYSLSRLRAKQDLIDGKEEDLAAKKPFYTLVLKATGAGNDDEEGLEALFSHPILLRDPEISQEREDLLLMRGELAERRSGGEDVGDADVINLKRRIADHESLIDLKKRDYLLGYMHDYEAGASALSSFQVQLELAETEFRRLSAVKREFDLQESFRQGYLVEAQRYFTLLEKLQGTRQQDFKPVRIVESAEPPWGPFKPNVPLNIGLAVVFGLVAGVGVAFFLEYLDDTVKTKEELLKITNVPLFGVIPYIATRRGESTTKDLYAYRQPKSTISEAFRGIRTALSYSSQKGENRVYLVTSAGPKEGKSTIVINVATVMAYSGTRTLLVDADLRRPRVHKSFELDNSRGLSNLIIGDAQVDDVVQSTEVENLFVLPSGPIPPNPSELLGRERMLEILEELRGRFDRILIDTPPIGAVTDAVVLGRIVDSVILVVHAGRTRKKLIERGLEQLNQIEVDVSGIVLNNLKIGRRRYYPGYYHYYYYYSSYYGADEKPKSRPRKDGRTAG